MVTLERIAKFKLHKTSIPFPVHSFIIDVTNVPGVLGQSAHLHYTVFMILPVKFSLPEDKWRDFFLASFKAILSYL